MARAYRFNFKHLDVYRAAIEHFAWTASIVARLAGAPFALRNQVIGAALSIPANVAEANGRDRKPGESEQHYRYAQGSTYECAAYLDALLAMNAIDPAEHALREENLARIASMLDRLARKQAHRRSPQNASLRNADP
jgi:four helix bundle protein